MLDQVIDLSHTALWTRPLPARLVRFTRLDGVILLIAESETSVTVGAETFLPLAECVIGGVSHSIGGEPSSLEITGAHSAGGVIDSGELKNGFWDGATVEQYLVNRNNLSTLGDRRFRGTIQSIDIDAVRGTFAFDCRGLTAEAESVIQTFMPMCGTDLYSVLCGVDPDAHKQDGTIGTVTDDFTITITGLPDPMVNFNQGTGETDAGFRFEIADAVNNSGTLTLRTWEPICLTRFEAGQDVTLYPGCAKTPEACRGYGAKLNFQGEDHFPGINSIAGV